MTREEAIAQVLTAWAIRLDLPVTTRQVESAAAEIERAVHRRDLRGPRLVTLTPKAGATPDAARELARRLEESYAPRPEVGVQR